MKNNTMKALLSSSERIATIGSPSTTHELGLDILGTAVGRRLVGELAYFHFLQDGKDHYALGQITEIELRNAWLEDPTMRSLARQKGVVHPVSGQQDTHIGKMILSAVFCDEGDNHFEPSMLGTVPATGTAVSIATERELSALLSQYQEQIFYLGKVYGSLPKLPMWFKHFDRGNNGAGEAYHLGIFGKSGSGKSVLAKMITLGYARHLDMPIFILDPQGEFAKDLKPGVQEQRTMNNVFSPKRLQYVGRDFQLYDLENISLNRWELFAQFLMEFNFLFDLGIKDIKYQQIASEYIEDFLRDNKKITFKSLSEQTIVPVLEHLKENIQKIYAGKAGIERVKITIDETLHAINTKENSKIFDTWKKTIRHFIPDEQKKSVNDIVSKIFNYRKVITIVDLFAKPKGIKKFVWDERIKPLIIDCFLDAMIDSAENFYRDDRSLNTLVVIDEAHRLAPRGRLENEKKEKIRNRLIDAVRTTRKYGLGWLFISQTLSSLDKEIIEQLRIYFFGFGLSMGTEFQALKEIAGGNQDELKLYQAFRDPHSSFDIKNRQYSFMTAGPVSPLSFSGKPLFFTAFNEIDEFEQANQLVVKDSQ